MTHRFAPAGALVLSSAAFGLALTALSATAQQPQGSPPATDVTSRVRGVAQPQAPTTEDKLPTSQLKVPQGFKVETYIHGVMDARSLRLGDKGTVFVGNRTRDKVYAVVSQGNRREAKVIGSGLDRPNGLAFKDGTLYIAEGTKISKLEKIEDNLDNPPKPVVIYSDFADHRSHGWKFLTIGPDNKLYVSVGAPCNVCEPPAGNAQIRRLNTDGSGAEPYALGVRNSVGFDFHPINKELYFTDNGRDLLSDDLPNDELNRVTRMGQHFGFPYCHQGDVPETELGAPPRVQRVRAAGRQARTTFGVARHALLHRHDVPAEISRRHLRRAPRLLEQVGEDRRRRRLPHAQPRRQRALNRAVPDRVLEGQ